MIKSFARLALVLGIFYVDPVLAGDCVDYSYEVCDGGACVCHSCGNNNGSWHYCDGCAEACAWCMSGGSSCN
jgi:hypothetical protein